jgi:hypothetical protein
MKHTWLEGWEIQKKLLYICAIVNNWLKIAFVSLFVVSTIGAVYADRGVGKRARSKTNLNVSMPSGSLRGSLGLNLKSGLAYKGSLQTTKLDVSQTLVSFQKGNTTYLLPFKAKLVSPDLRPGYSGLKIVIRAPK